MTQFRGAPFRPGKSTVQPFVRATGGESTAIAGPKTAIGVLPVSGRAGSGWLLLQHASSGSLFGGSGQRLHL